MKRIELNPKLYVIAGVIVAGAMMRFIPHWPNFTPIAAIGLMGGTFFKRKELAFIVPVAAMLLSDLVIGFHSTMFAVYASFLAIVGIGILLSRKLTLLNMASATLLSSVVFYLVTNFASWSTGMMPYSPDIAGLMQSYIAGIPFFFNGIMGDLFFTTVLFGSLYLITNRLPAYTR